MLLRFTKSFTLKSGLPMGIPSAFASFERDTTQPSLLDNTIAGLFLSLGLKTRSQETKKLLQSAKANMVKPDESRGTPRPKCAAQKLQ